MKQVKKNKDGFVICEECGKICKNFNGLSTHIRHSHDKNIKNILING